MRWIIVLFMGLNTTCHAKSGFEKSEIQEMVAAIEADFGLPHKLLHAIVQQESGYRVWALNPASRKGTRISSYGLGQLTETTASWHCDLAKRYIYRPYQNLQCAAKVLEHQVKRYKGNLGRAIAAYNWGTPCECDGKHYKQKLRKKVRTCTTLRKGRAVPLRCNRIGTFLNQDYVDGVTQKMNKALRSSKPKSYVSLIPEAPRIWLTGLRDTFF